MSVGRPAVRSQPEAQRRRKAFDVRVSRFPANEHRNDPVSSPHGTIMGEDRRPRDRVVDGGYFENFGALTATELARALEAKGLRPLVVLITNEPTMRAMESSVCSRVQSPERAASTAPQYSVCPS